MVAGTGSAQFALNPIAGPYVSESVYSFPTVKQAKAMLDAVRTQASCGTYDTVSDETTRTVTIAPVSFSKVGDDTVANRQTTSIPGQTGSTTGSTDQISVRLANNVITIAEGALGGPDANLEQRFVGKSVSKLGVALEAAKKAQRATTTTTTPKKK